MLVIDYSRYRIQATKIFVLGLALNIAGSSFASLLNGLLFLDTIGTALVAIALGPWWGATVGAATNLVLSELPGKEFVINYLIVNVFCGFFWGYLGASRIGVFQGSLSYSKVFGSVLFLGITGGAVASIIALITTFKFELYISNFDASALRTWHPADKYYSWLLESGYIESAGTVFQVVLRDVIALLPDKIVSIALAIVIIFYFLNDFVHLARQRNFDYFRCSSKYSYLVFLIVYCFAFLEIAFYGNITMNAGSATVHSREVIVAQVVMWSVPIIWVLYKLIRQHFRGAEVLSIGNDDRLPINVIWTVYRDILTILAAFFTILFANKTDVSVSNNEIVMQMSNIFNDGWGMLGFFAVFGFVPVFLMRICAVDPDHMETLQLNQNRT